LVQKCAGKVLQRVHGTLGKVLLTLHPTRDQVISLKPDGPVQSHVLLSYRIEGVLPKRVNSVPLSWRKTERIAKNFLSCGYAVDVIANTNKEFRPEKEYGIFIDTRMNLERLAPLLDKNCIKILYATSAHPYFHNAAAAKRLLDLQERKHVTLRSRRFMPPDYAMAVEYADCILVPSEFCLQNYRYAKKPFYLLPNPADYVYPWMETKDYESARTRFLWLGSMGMVHKGLDLVLEAFSEMPEFHLTVCGPVAGEKDFEQLYEKELYHMPNIHTLGWIDTGSPDFLHLAAQCVGLIYPSCSEGSANAVITCLHAGLIPIISYESGVDVNNDIGIMLQNCSIREIKEAMRKIAGLSAQELKHRSRKAWEFARANHTMEQFDKQLRILAEKLLVDFPR